MRTQQKSTLQCKQTAEESGISVPQIYKIL